MPGAAAICVNAAELPTDRSNIDQPPKQTLPHVRHEKYNRMSKYESRRDILPFSDKYAGLPATYDKLWR